MKTVFTQVFSVFYEHGFSRDKSTFRLQVAILNLLTGSDLSGQSKWREFETFALKVYQIALLVSAIKLPETQPAKE